MVPTRLLTSPGDLPGLVDSLPEKYVVRTYTFSDVVKELQGGTLHEEEMGEGKYHFAHKPELSQHAYIKAIEVDNKAGRGGVDQDCITKAQTLDPDHTLAWIGQALIATANGLEADARTLLEHAVSMIADVPMADLQFALCVLAAGVEYINRAITLLEAAYEDQEDPMVERQFIIPHTSIARLRLGLRDYEGSLASFETALGLLLWKALMTIAFFEDKSRFYWHRQCGRLERPSDASLQKACYLIGQNATSMISSQLIYRCNITSDPENLMAINTLAGMGILTEDDGLVDAALSEILSLPVEQRHELDPRRDVMYLLVQLSWAGTNLTLGLLSVQF
ncbi:hypothetical protein EDB19DRAFT_1959977 [Suillus lakei]|nr:hypothetical protein EDB19DRAFT_1959977 [Suillus lakei]